MEASSFWARKHNEIKSSTQSVSTTTTPAQATDHTRKSLVLNHKSKILKTGTAPYYSQNTPTSVAILPANKKTQWVDSEDDNDFFLASQHKGDNPSILALEKEVSTHHGRIAQLETTVAMKNDQVAQLETEMQGKEQRIIDLETNTKGLMATVEQFREENHRQYLYVQEFVMKADKNCRQVEELRIELGNTSTRVNELRSNSEIRTRTLTAKDVLAAKQDCEEMDQAHGQNDAFITHATEEDDNTRSVDTDAVADQDTEAIESQTLVHDAPQKTWTEKKALGPAINDKEFPLMWMPPIPGAPKSEPVEKPKVLMMAIDTSSYGKKAAISKSRLTKSQGIFTSPVGQASKQYVKTDIAPKIEPHLDIRHMSHAQRIPFANGPKVDVFLGEEKIGSLSKYVLCQCSGNASRHFNEHPEAAKLVYPQDSMDAAAAKTHLRWMDDMTYQGRVYSINLNADARHDMKNLEICRAARVLGLNNTYVGHFTKMFCERIRSGKSSVELISKVCALAYPENDPIFDCLANNLATQESLKANFTSTEIEKLLAKYPALQEKMKQVDQLKKSRRAKDEAAVTTKGVVT